MSEDLVKKTVTIFERQADRLIKANLSKVVRMLIDKHFAEQDTQHVTLWENNAGGCWMADAKREYVWDMGTSGSQGTSFYEDASDIFLGWVAEWDIENRHLYDETIEVWEEISMVAEYNGSTATIHTEGMGAGAREYCGVPDLS